MDLLNEVNQLGIKLNQAISLLAKYGREWAEAEKDYKITLNQVTFKLKDEKGIKVTMLDKVVYGEKEVADKRYKRDIAEVMYKTAQENVNAIKLQLRIAENQLDREWCNTK